MTRKLQAVVLTSLFCFFVGGCYSDPAQKGRKDKKSSEGNFFRMRRQPVGVTPLTLVAKEVPLVITAAGKTEASDHFIAKAPTTVNVQKIFVEEGAKVSAGDPLIQYNNEIDKLRLAKAQAEIREAEASVANDNYLIQNKEKLMQEGKMSETEAEGLDEKLNMHQATIDRAKAEVELYERLAELEQVNSPIGGIVTRKLASEGGEVQEDQGVLEVSRLDPVHFIFTAPVDSIGALEKGAEIVVHIQGFPLEDFTGEILSAETERDSPSKEVTVKLKIPNPDLTIKSDLTGDVVVRTQARKKVFPVPETALLKTERSTYVFKIDGNSVKKVPVEIGESVNNQPTISKGLAEGDLIVASSDEELQDGAAVEVRAAVK